MNCVYSGEFRVVPGIPWNSPPPPVYRSIRNFKTIGFSRKFVRKWIDWTSRDGPVYLTVQLSVD